MPDALQPEKCFACAPPSVCDSLLLNLLSAADCLRQIKLLHGPEGLVIQHPLLSSLHSLIASLHAAPSLSPKDML